MSYLFIRVVQAFVNDNFGMLVFRSKTIDEVPEQIGALTGFNFYGYNFVNNNNADVFVKIYNNAVAPVVGITVPVDTIQVPGRGSVVLFSDTPLLRFSSKGWIAAVTGFADNSISPPTSDLIVRINYK